eukprot:352869-Chlamydomonas_euryale.AAC.2
MLAKSCSLNTESLYTSSAGPCHADMAGLSVESAPWCRRSKQNASRWAPESSAFWTSSLAMLVPWTPYVRARAGVGVHAACPRPSMHTGHAWRGTSSGWACMMHAYGPAHTRGNAWRRTSDRWTCMHPPRRRTYHCICTCDKRVASAAQPRRGTCRASTAPFRALRPPARTSG